jgi:hypothetical protein
MGRIKINDLPANLELSDAEIKRTFGGIAASWSSWRAIAVNRRQWATPGAKIIGPGIFAQEPLETELP